MRWWLSFVGEEGARGVAIVDLPDSPHLGMSDAIFASHRRGCNPGGEVAVMAIPPELVVAADKLNRVLPPDEAKALAADFDRQIDERDARLSESVREGMPIGEVTDEMKAMFYGSKERFDAVNEQTRALLVDLSALCSGADIAAAINATMIMMIGAMKADGSTLEKAIGHIRDAWESPVLEVVKFEREG